MSSSSDLLKKHRLHIDQIDRKILQLLSERGREVQAIGYIKQNQGKSFYVPEREALVLKNLLEINEGPLSEKAVVGIFREIMSASLALEAPLHIAYLGPEGTFSHLAATRKFGKSAIFHPQKKFREIFEEVVSGRVQYGIIPIENSTEGVVSQNLDLFMEYTLEISGEIQVEINHNLLGVEKKISLSQIQTVYSHSQALAQCRHWLEKHLPHAKLRAVESTSAAAKMASRDKKTAAIASAYAAQLYQLEIIRKNIEDQPNNFTRFLIIGKQKTNSTGHDKTTIMFSTRDQAGVLYRLLKPLADEKLNLTKIESRPLKKKAWEYVFFIDLDGHQKDVAVAKALRKVEKECSFFQILGSYPREVE